MRRRLPSAAELDRRVDAARELAAEADRHVATARRIRERNALIDIVADSLGIERDRRNGGTA